MTDQGLSMKAHGLLMRDRSQVEGPIIPKRYKVYVLVLSRRVFCFYDSALFRIDYDSSAYVQILPAKLHDSNPFHLSVRVSHTPINEKDNLVAVAYTASSCQYDLPIILSLRIHFPQIVVPNYLPAISIRQIQQGLCALL